MNRFTQKQALIRAAEDKIVSYINQTGVLDPEMISKNIGLKIEFIKTFLNKKESETKKTNEALKEHVLAQISEEKPIDETLRRIKNNSPKLYRLRDEIIAYAKTHYDLNALSFADVQEICLHFNYGWAKTEISYFLGYEPKTTLDIVKMMDRYYQPEVLSLKHLSPELISVKTGLRVERILTLLKEPPELLTHQELRDLTARDWFKKQNEIKEKKKARYAALREKLQDRLHDPIQTDEMKALSESIESTFTTTKNELAILRKAYPKTITEPLSFADFGEYSAISFILPTQNMDEAFITLHKTLANVFPLYKQSLGRISQKRHYQNIDVIVCSFLFDKPVEMPTLNFFEEYWGKHEQYQVNVFPHIINKVEGLGNLLSQEDCVFRWFGKEIVSKPKEPSLVQAVIKPWQNKKELRQKAVNYYYAQMRNKHAQEIAFETGYTYQHILKIMSNLPEDCPSLTAEEKKEYELYFKEEIEAEKLRKEKAKQVDALIQGKTLDKMIIKEVIAKTGKTASYIYSRAKTLKFMFKPDAERAELVELKSMLNKALALVEKALSKN